MSRTTNVMTMAGAAMLAACAAEVPEDLQVGVTKQAIINGDPRPEAWAERQGVVKLRHYNNLGAALCTGTLVRNDLVLTARHCVTQDGTRFTDRDPHVRNYTAWVGEQELRVSAVLPLGQGAEEDVALLQLRDYAAMDGSLFDYERPLYRGTAASQTGRDQLCYGYGRTDPNTPSAAELHTATLQSVGATGDGRTLFQANSAGQYMAYGDSGGGCFLGSQVTGVASQDIAGSATFPAGQLVESTERFLDWYDRMSTKRAAIDIHETSAGNSVGGESLVDHPVGNGSPHVGVQVTQNTELGQGNGHVTGVRYDSATQRWMLAHADGAQVPAGSAYNISFGGGGKRIETTASSVRGHVAVIDLPSLNGRPHRSIFVTPDLSGAPNPHPVGVSYDDGHFQIYNEDLSPMPVGARFQLRIGYAGEATFLHTADATNVVGNWTYLDHPLLNDQPDAQFLVTHNYNPNNASTGTFFTSPIGVAFDEPTGQWMILTQDYGAMPWGAAFNILVSP